jgi:hypothetical protein
VSTSPLMRPFLRFFVVVVLLPLLAQCQQYTNCTGWTLQRNQFIRLLPKVAGGTFAVQKPRCNATANGADVAVLNDPVNIPFVQSTCGSVTGAPKTFAIGLSQINTSVVTGDFNWTWVDGTGLGSTPYGYVGWGKTDAQEPSTAGGLFQAYFDCAYGVFANYDPKKNTDSVICTIPVHKCQNPFGYSCPLGMFSSGGSCSMCSPGTYSYGNQTICLSCEVGKFALNQGSSVCLECPINFYADTRGASSCFECPAPSNTSTTGSTSMSSCRTQLCPSIGWNNVTVSGGMDYISNTSFTSAITMRQAEYQCSQLYHGAHVPIASSSAVITAISSIQTWVGGRNYGEGGMVWNDGTVVTSNDTSNMNLPAASKTVVQCIRKAASSYSWVTCESYLASACHVQQGSCAQVLCSPGSILNISSKVPYTCGQCAAGKYQNASGMIICDDCRVNTFSSSGSSSCSSCPAGKWTNGSSGQSACSDCTAGLFSQTSGASCTVCSSGSFQNTSGSTYCLSCPIGKYASSSGSTICLNCGSGYYQSRTGFSFCSPCSVGTFQNVSGSSSCDICANGFVASSSASSSCTQCSAGLFSNDSRVCVNCIPGTYQSKSAQSYCDTCLLGTFASSAGSTACSACSVGFFSNDSKSCISCSLGTFQNSSSQTYCETCLFGTVASALGATFCSDCSIGLFSNDSRMCISCFPGSFQNMTSQSYCNICEPGLIASTPGSTACSSCQSGYFTNDAKTCFGCSPGTYQNNVSQTFCQFCPNGTVSPDVGASTCTSCQSGFYSSTDRRSCTSCSPGSYQSQPAQTSCSLCLAGSYSNSSQSECSYCLPGKYQSTAGASYCQTCPDGSISNSSGLSSCHECPAGTFENAKVYCMKCSAGRYSAGDAATSCKPCSTGSYAEEEGSSTCVRCPNESSSLLPGATSVDLCNVCGEGFYGGYNVSLCKQCPRIAGISCPLGSVVPFVKSGYFRSSDDPTQIFSCFPEAACSSTGFSMQTTCSEAYSGLRCSVCSDNFYRKNGECKSCPGTAAKVLTFLLMAALVLVILFQLVSSQHGLPAEIRISLYYLQFLALFPQITSNWPNALLKVFDWLSLTVSKLNLPSFTLTQRLFVELEH